MKVSVCMASYNGDKYIKKQIDSILCQINQNDELIISDDGSTDKTVEIIKSYSDRRIKLINNITYSRDRRTHVNVSSNFENSLSYSSGDIIFLSDQDDIWEKNKIESFLIYLKKFDLVVSDCRVIDSNDQVIFDSFFKHINSGKGIIKNIFKSTYHGSCLAFNRKILNLSLPFPRKLVMHDAWLGLIAEMNGKVIFIEEKLTNYRIHTSNVSGTKNSDNSLFFKLYYRANILLNLLLRYIKRRININRTDTKNIKYSK